MNPAYAIHILFAAYTLLLFVRIVDSWFPDYRHHHLLQFVAFYTDPYLNFFRKLMPPLGGQLDLSPILAFLSLRFLESLILGLLR